MKLALVVREGDAVRIGAALVRLERKSGRSARLVVYAPSSVPVRRGSGRGQQLFTKIMTKPLDKRMPAMD